MKKLIVIFQLLMLVLVVPAQAQNQKKDFRKDFEAFKKKAKKEYADFRKQALAEYTKFVREAWEEFGAEPPVAIPEEEKVEPMVVPGYEEETAGFFSKLFGGDDKKDKKAQKEKEKKEGCIHNWEYTSTRRRRKKRKRWPSVRSRIRYFLWKPLCQLPLPPVSSLSPWQRLNRPAILILTISSMSSAQSVRFAWATIAVSLFLVFLATR